MPSSLPLIYRSLCYLPIWAQHEAVYVLHHFSFLKFLPYVTGETVPRPFLVTQACTPHNGQRSGTAVNWSNLGWWVPTCVSVTCKNKAMGWHIETGDTLGWAAPQPIRIHAHTYIDTSTCPSPSPLALWKQHHVPDKESVVTIAISVSWAALFT